MSFTTWLPSGRLNSVTCVASPLPLPKVTSPCIIDTLECLVPALSQPFWLRAEKDMSKVVLHNRVRPFSPRHKVCPTLPSPLIHVSLPFLLSTLACTLKLVLTILLQPSAQRDTLSPFHTSRKLTPSLSWPTFLWTDFFFFQLAFVSTKVSRKTQPKITLSTIIPGIRSAKRKKWRSTFSTFRHEVVRV